MLNVCKPTVSKISWTASLLGRSLKTVPLIKDGIYFFRLSSSMARPVRIREEEGNLFQASRCTSLAHCVSSDMKMGAGIAVLFRKKFGRVDDLKEQKKDVGEVAYLKDGPRYIFYLVTKKWFFDKPTELTLQQSLLDMRSKCEKFGVKKLAMPRIGCGLDGLKWPLVFHLVREIFSSNDMEITIYSFPDRNLSPYLTKSQDRFRSFFECNKPRSAPLCEMTSKRKIHTFYSDDESETPRKKRKTISTLYDKHSLFHSSNFPLQHSSPQNDCDGGNIALKRTSLDNLTTPRFTETRWNLKVSRTPSDTPRHGVDLPNPIFQRRKTDIPFWSTEKERHNIQDSVLSPRSSKLEIPLTSVRRSKSHQRKKSCSSLEEAHRCLHNDLDDSAEDSVLYNVADIFSIEPKSPLAPVQGTTSSRDRKSLCDLNLSSRKGKHEWFLVKKVEREVEESPTPRKSEHISSRISKHKKYSVFSDSSEEVEGHAHGWTSSEDEKFVKEDAKSDAKLRNSVEVKELFRWTSSEEELEKTCFKSPADKESNKGSESSLDHSPLQDTASKHSRKSRHSSGSRRKKHRDSSRSRERRSKEKKRKCQHSSGSDEEGFGDDSIKVEKKSKRKSEKRESLHLRSRSEPRYRDTSASVSKHLKKMLKKRLKVQSGSSSESEDCASTSFNWEVKKTPEDSHQGKLKRNQYSDFHEQGNEESIVSSKVGRKQVLEMIKAELGRRAPKISGSGKESEDLCKSGNLVTQEPITTKSSKKTALLDRLKMKPDALPERSHTLKKTALLDRLKARLNKNVERDDRTISKEVTSLSEYSLHNIVETVSDRRMYSDRESDHVSAKARLSLP